MTKYYKSRDSNSHYKVNDKSIVFLTNGDTEFGWEILDKVGQVYWGDVEEVTKEDYESAVKEVLKRIEDENG